MSKKIFMILAFALILTACGREQKNTDMVMNKEVPEDFTRQPQPASQATQTTPMLPGKAQVLGAPFLDFPTQTGSATVLPSQNQTVSVPNSSP